MKRTIELFCGTKSFSKVAEKKGFETFTLDNDPYFNPDLCKDILSVQASDLPSDIDILWASPPCTTFSVASLRHYWTTDGKPKNEKTWKGMNFVMKTLKLIEEIKPKYWFIENPRGMLRKQWFMDNIHRKTITYCQYGDFRMKPTDIWTNLEKWTPRPMCKPGSPCHESAKRGADKGTQSLGGGGKRGAVARGMIPPAIFEEIFEVIE